MMWRVAAIVLLVLLALAAPPAIRHLRETPPPFPPAVRLVLEPPAGAEFGDGAASFDVAISPTGEEMTFVATTAGESQLWRRRLDGRRAERIPGTTSATLPAYAADGSLVWYFAVDKLRTFNLSTGEHRDAIDAPTAGGAAVRSDGAVLFASGSLIHRLAGGVASPVTKLGSGETNHAFPAWVDATDAFVYLATLADGRRIVRFRDGDTDVELTRADSHAIVAAGHLLFVRDGMLRAAPFDRDSRRLGPRAETLALDVGVSPQGRGAFAVGGHVLASGPPSRRQYVLRWLAGTGEPIGTISEPGDYWQVRLSPDERTAAVSMRDPLLRTLDVFTLGVDGSTPTRFTLALAADTDPVWSADGRRIAFRSAQDGQPQLYARAVSSGGGADEAIWRSPADEFPTDWRPEFVVFHARRPDSGFDIWALPPNSASPRALVRSGFNEKDGRVSPDGQWLAYASDEGGQFDVYIGRVDDAARRTRISTAGGTRPQWIAGGSAVVFARGPELLRSSLLFAAGAVRPSTPVRVLNVPGLRDVAASRNGARFLVIAPIESVQERNVDVVAGWRALLDSQ
jgi:eukaryotic-like serine/threonine-protein kinase